MHHYSIKIFTIFLNLSDRPFEIDPQMVQRNIYVKMALKIIFNNIPNDTWIRDLFSERIGSAIFFVDKGIGYEQADTDTLPFLAMKSCDSLYVGGYFCWALEIGLKLVDECIHSAKQFVNPLFVLLSAILIDYFDIYSFIIFESFINASLEI